MSTNTQTATFAEAQVSKQYFDVIVVVPLEEEFDVVLEYFGSVEDLSSATHIRFAASLASQPTRVLVVKQSAMGKTACQLAASECLSEFGCGILACVGIAGALSHDLSIGDICYSRSVFDVQDNTKINEDGISLSPTWYESPPDLLVPIALDRVKPQTKPAHIAWLGELEKLGKQLIPGEFTGRDGKESIGRPSVHEGIIACGSVSSSPKYNEKLRAIDRKVLAVETEAGGLFSVARQHGVPAIAIRGISDYAGVDKNEFERDTKGNARKFAISTAASFLVRQLAAPGLVSYLDKLALKRATAEAMLPFDQIEPSADAATDILIKLSEEFDGKLRDLAPGYALITKGYRIPVPRIRIVENRSGAPDARGSKPIEVRDAMRDARVITLHVPREYPDLSLSWIIARDLLSAQLGDSQLVPSVIEAHSLQRPRFGIAQLVNPQVATLTSSPEFTAVFVINEFNFQSRSRSEFLREQIDAWPNAKFVVVTRNREDVYQQTEFTKNVASAMARLCDVSFMEISTFIQKNYEMPPSASEVVAVRLRETFHKYSLPAHPSYFAGIPRSALNALLQANRRAELIELAVAGYLSFVVAEDKEPVALSRTTREKFLAELAFSMHVGQHTYTEAQLTAYAEEFAKRFDFNIAPARFISTFIENHLLHIEGDHVIFTLPFMEAYLLAKRLGESPAEAAQYFAISSKAFDYRCFSIYAELGASSTIVSNLLAALDAAIDVLTPRPAEAPFLFDPTISVALLDQHDRLHSIQRRLQQAEDDVRNDRDQSKQKQQLLDASDLVRENLAARSSATQASDVTEAETTWAVAVNLLGSGAERLEASIKRDLVQKVAKLSGLIINQWMRARQAVDFSAMKRELSADAALIDKITKSMSHPNHEEARKVIENLSDLLEYVFRMQPFMGVVTYLCEEARDIVLAESIANTVVTADVDELVLNMWLCDIDVPRGTRPLVTTIKRMPRAKFLRHAIAGQLMVRVFWKHWRKSDRLALLSVADESLKGIGIRKKTGELKRIIENLRDDNDDNEP